MISRSKVVASRDVTLLSVPNFNPNAWTNTNVERLIFSSIDTPSANAAGSQQDTEDHPLPSMPVDTADKLNELEAEAKKEGRAEEIATALEEGRVEGTREANAECERRLAHERAQIFKCCSDFLQRQEGYFAAVEEQVVELALAIAKRILHREVTAEPMVLRTAVKAVLMKIADERGIVLRVPLAETESWRELLQEHLPGAIEVQGEGHLASGECILETGLGRVELGIDAQMEEIDKSFSDLQNQRPA